MKQTLKQTLAAILAATMMTAMFSTGAAAAEQSDAALLGDVDGDGAVTITDATFIQHKLAGSPIPFEFDERVADADEDNSITITDVTYIQKWLTDLPSNPNIGKPLREKKIYNPTIRKEYEQTVLKYCEKIDSKRFNFCNKSVISMLTDVNPDAAYYCMVADTSVAGLAAHRTNIYSVSEGSTTADVFEELDDKTTKIGTINVTVVKAEMADAVAPCIYSNKVEGFGYQHLKANLGSAEFDQKAAVNKLLIGNEELGTHFSEDDFTVTYQSSDEKVAVISDDGMISAVGNGECDISLIFRFTDGSEYEDIRGLRVTGLSIETVDGYSIDNIRDYVVGLNTPVELADGTMTPMINFDNAATTPALKAVRDAINEELEMYGSIGRGFSQKSNHSTDVYNSVRDKVLEFFTADPDLYTCFYVNSTTDGLNKLASALIESEDDLVLTTRIEHHANDLSWRERCKVIYAEVDEKGRVIYDDIERLLQENNVKIVSISAASNVTGYVNDVHRVAKTAHQYGAQIVVDGAQIVAHRKFEMMGDLDDPDDDIDFFAFSAHKMYSPYGGGAVVGLTNTLNEHMPEFYGGGTITVVGDYWQVYKSAPAAYEAGSPNYPGVVGLGKAIDVLSTVGMDKIEAHEKVLNRKLIDGLKTLPNVIIYGDTEDISDKVGVVTFNFSDINTYLISQKLSELGGVATRRGAFCAHPYVWRLMGITDEIARTFANCTDANTAGMVRVSFGIYNNEEEVDRFLELMPSVMEAAKADQTPMIKPEY